MTEPTVTAFTVGRVTEPDTELVDLARTLTHLDSEMKALREQRDHIIAALAAAMPSKVVELPGVGVLERRGGRTRKAWDHEMLMRLVLARSRDERRCDPETGEFEDAGEAAVRVLAECAHVDYWRSTALRQRGVDPDEYAESTPAPPSVIFRPAEGAA